MARCSKKEKVNIAVSVITTAFIMVTLFIFIVATSDLAQNLILLREEPSDNVLRKVAVSKLLLVFLSYIYMPALVLSLYMAICKTGFKAIRICGIMFTVYCLFGIVTGIVACSGGIH